MTDLLDQKVQVQSLVDIVTERLEAAIISGNLEPGSRLQEKTLSASLGVSRGPLREAIRRLEGRRLVERTPNKGVRVTSLTRKDFSELHRLQEVLQGLASALAAEHVTDEELRTLEETLAAHRERAALKGADLEYAEDLDAKFHTQIIKASRNERLIDLLSGDLHFLIRVNQYKFTVSPKRAQAVLDEHAAILDALKKRDPEAAEHTMREHIRAGRRELESQFAGSLEPTPD